MSEPRDIEKPLVERVRVPGDRPGFGRREQARADRRRRRTGPLGGDQRRLTGIVGGTPLEQAIHQAFMNGACVAGTSAGAAVMSARMLWARSLTEGFGLLPQVIVDQHFTERRRLPRLLRALSRHPDLYRPLLLARVLHLPPPSLPLAWTLYAVLVVGCLVGAAGRVEVARRAVMSAWSWSIVRSSTTASRAWAAIGVAASSNPAIR